MSPHCCSGAGGVSSTGSLISDCGVSGAYCVIGAIGFSGSAGSW